MIRQYRNMIQQYRRIKSQYLLLIRQASGKTPTTLNSFSFIYFVFVSWFVQLYLDNLDNLFNNIFTISNHKTK